MDGFLDNEKSNKIILVLAILFVLLVFMDLQARRHFQNQLGYDMDATQYASQRAEQASHSIQQPVRSTIDAIFGKSRKVISDPFKDPQIQVHNNTALLLQGTSSQSDLNTYAQKVDAHLEPNRANLIEPVPQFYYLYFIRFQRGRSELVRVKRNVGESYLSLESVLNSLQKGPSLRETGLINTFTDKIKINSIQRNQGQLIVDMGEQVGYMGSHVIQDRLDQLVFTLTQFSDIDNVKLLMDGQAINSLGAQSVAVPNPIYRRNRKIFAQPID